MKKLRTVIADDESLARKLLRTFLVRDANVQLIAECKNGRETVQSVQDLTPDLLFLDIQMPGTSGFDVVKQLQSEIMPIVVFCTAHQRFALDIFDEYGVDYLLKPMDEQLIQRAVQRSSSRLSHQAHLPNRKTALINAIMAIDALLEKLDKDDIAPPEQTLHGGEGAIITGESVLEFGRVSKYSWGTD